MAQICQDKRDKFGVHYTHRNESVVMDTQRMASLPLHDEPRRVVMKKRGVQEEPVGNGHANAIKPATVLWEVRATLVLGVGFAWV